MEDEIINLAKSLNKRGVLPEIGLRRNSIYYPLISYINHTIALYISEEYDDVALFIMRAEKELNRLKEYRKEEEKYFNLCERYLWVLSKYIIEKGVEGIELLPDKYKK